VREKSLIQKCFKSFAGFIRVRRSEKTTIKSQLQCKPENINIGKAMTTSNQVITIESEDESQHPGGWSSEELNRFQLFTVVLNGQVVR
jgi:hypothetical protein